MGYSNFIAAMGSVDNFKSFYESDLWDGWEKEAEAVSADQVLSFYPPLFCAVGDDKAGASSDGDGTQIGKRSRKAIPVSEIEQSHAS